MKVDQLMTQPAVSCRTDDTLGTAARLMWDHDCGVVPVVNDAGSVVGIITDRDICMAAYTQGVPLHSIPTRTAMAREVFTCRPDDGVEGVERLMRDKQIRRVPVVDGDGHPIGMLSLNDIARGATSGEENNGFGRDVTELLAAIGQPRRCAPRTLLGEPSFIQLVAVR